MFWCFGTFRLDPERFELSKDGAVVSIEPQVFSVLLHLIRNRHRMVPKEELVEAVWRGGAVSDSSLSSRIRSARLAVGDDGHRQAVIRTVHRKGFCFIAEVQVVDVRPAAAVPPEAPSTEPRTGRPSIAVLPFQALGLDERRSILSEAIPHEIIQALSRLRWLFVTARGSSFRFRGEQSGVDLVATALGVRYVLSGIVEETGRGLAVSVELTDSGAGEVIWGERLTATPTDIDDLRHRIVTSVMAALETVVPETEAQSALRTGADRFDAWANYHIGLRHLYRFTAADNAVARHHFDCAARLDPSLARAQAGLSFTSFVDAFLRIVPDVPAAIAAARRHAERGLALDSLDPFVSFNMGRTHWLTQDPEGAMPWLSRATSLNPNYAQGFYASAFTSMLLGHQEATTADLDLALRLSPLDPLLYGIHGVRAQLLVQQGDYAAAASWAARAVATPGAHHLIGMIAIVAFDLAGDREEAARWRNEVRKRRPDVAARDYFNAFPTRDAASRDVIAAALRRHGF